MTRASRVLLLRGEIMGVVKRILVVTSVAPLATLAYAAPGASTTERLLEDRRRVEEVYWRHTDWPAVNPTPKPAASEVLTDEVIRAKVATSLRKLAALEQFWGRVPTHREIQSEMD